MSNGVKTQLVDRYPFLKEVHVHVYASCYDPLEDGLVSESEPESESCIPVEWDEEDFDEDGHPLQVEPINPVPDWYETPEGEWEPFDYSLDWLANIVKEDPAVWENNYVPIDYTAADPSADVLEKAKELHAREHPDCQNTVYTTELDNSLVIFTLRCSECGMNESSGARTLNLHDLQEAYDELRALHSRCGRPVYIEYDVEG